MFIRSGQLSSTSQEDDLLRCCARVSHDERTRDRFERLLRGPIDWPAFMCRCWWHRIRPLAFRHLCAYAPADDMVPRELWAQLSTHAAEIATRNARLFQALNEVATWFEDRGIRMLVFKGPTLALDAYGDLSLRECGDLDLLVHRDDLPEVIDLLTGHEFTLLESEFVSGGTAPAAASVCLRVPARRHLSGPALGPGAGLAELSGRFRTIVGGRTRPAGR